MEIRKEKQKVDNKISSRACDHIHSPTKGRLRICPSCSTHSVDHLELLLYSLKHPLQFMILYF